MPALLAAWWQEAESAAMRFALKPIPERGDAEAPPAATGREETIDYKIRSITAAALPKTVAREMTNYKIEGHAFYREGRTRAILRKKLMPPTTRWRTATLSDILTTY